MYQGIIKYLKDSWGFLGIEGQERDVFFHQKELEGVNFQDLKVGDDVEVGEIAKTPKGHQAKKVKLV